jgi:hypothetical protein
MGTQAVCVLKVGVCLMLKTKDVVDDDILHLGSGQLKKLILEL